MSRDDRHVELTPEEGAALAALRLEREPPPEVEMRVLQAIAARNAPASPGRRRARTLTGLAAAATFVLGLALGPLLQRTEPGPATLAETTGSAFMLLLYEDASYQQPADPAARVREYVDWAASLVQQGRFVAGDELAGGGVAVAPDSEPMALAVDATRDQPQGYFVILAEDEADAARLAATCPHVRYGGRIVVRRLAS